jgi:hypothetical protein
LISIKDPRLFPDSWGQITKLPHLLYHLFRACSTQIINDEPLEPLTRRKCVDNLSSLHKNSAEIFIKPIVKEGDIDQRKKERKREQKGTKEKENHQQKKKKISFFTLRK